MIFFGFYLDLLFGLALDLILGFEGRVSSGNFGSILSREVVLPLI